MTTTSSIATVPITRLGMNFPQKIGSGAAAVSQQNTYRGVMWDPGRMPMNPLVRTADQEFIGYRRQLSWNTTLDLLQNLDLIGWMMRQHLAYTALFTVATRTLDVQYNREWREWFRLRTMKKKVDVQRRFSLSDMMINFGGLQILHGYAPILKVKDGKLQLFEAWNMARGAGVEVDEKRLGVTVNSDGVVLDENGAIDFVALATGPSTGELVHRYLAYHDEVILDGFTERASGTLWESPLMSVLNKARDYLDTDEFQLLKAKLHAMFVVHRILKPETEGGAGFPTRQGTWGLPSGSTEPPTDGINDQPITPPNPAIPAPPPLSEIRPNTMVTGEPGDKIEFLESRTPSHEYQAFTQKLCGDLCSVMDIPLTFKYSHLGTYSSLKADAVRYSQSLTVQQQRAKNAASTREAIVHIMRDGVAKRDMPMWKGKYTVDTLPLSLVGRAPWMLDPAKEMPMLLSQLSACLTDWESTCDLLGTDFYDTVDRQAEQRAYAAKRGVRINLGELKVMIRDTETVGTPIDPAPRPADDREAFDDTPIATED